MSGPVSLTNLHVLSILVDAIDRMSSRRACWRIEDHSTPPRCWVSVCHESGGLPEQGWKLHLAASVGSAADVLRTALPVLLQADATFKVVASLQQLAELNEGRGGFGQVGKFITIYPRNEGAAVSLARALDEATGGLRALAIPSDRPLRAGSIVHYRYGGFANRHLRTPLGEILPAIVTPGGVLEPDRRLGVYYVPSWAPDPFVAAGIAEELPPLRRRIGERYVLLATIHRSLRSTVHLCLDLDVPRRCVIKAVVQDGLSSFDRLRHEAAVLSRLVPDRHFPTPFELFQDGDDLFLSMEDIDGQTLERALSLLRERCVLPAREDTMKWGCELATILATIHGRGFVYRDLKASNVIVTPDGQLRLVDFELAHEQGDRSSGSTFSHGLGTKGYMSPQQAAGRVPETADDIYGLGALLYLLVTGAEPSQAPNPASLLDRPIEVLNPAVGPSLARVIERCLDPVPARRFESPLHVRSALIKAGADEIDAGPSGVEGGNHMGETEPTARLRSSELARRLGDTLCASAKRAADGRFAGWVSDGPFAEAYPSTDLNAGGGAVVALAELVAAFDDPIHRATLRESAQWLADASRPLGAPLAGLHVGEAGAGVAQLRAGQVLGDPDLLAACAARGRWIATLPHSSPDLFGGTSGRLRFHLWLWEETCDPSHLRDAIAAGQQLLGRAEQVTGGGLRWRIPPGYDSLSNHAWLGYAHGAAGIGDALLDLFEVTWDERFLEAAQGAGQWLKELARPALEDRSGLNWPVTEDNPLTMAFWCHGATGIGRFMLHLAQLDALPSALEHAERASRVAACGARWAGATQCHGLAGNIEFLLDMYQAQGNAGHLHEARSLAHLLTAFARDVNGALHWLTDSDVSNPGFAAGCSGVATCLLRLAQPETLPHALNGAGFRRPSARHKQRNLSDSADRAT